MDIYCKHCTFTEQDQKDLGVHPTQIDLDLDENSLVWEEARAYALDPGHCKICDGPYQPGGLDRALGAWFRAQQGQ